MNLFQFAETRKVRWARLEALVSQVRTGGGLNGRDFRELGTLYRATAADLAYAQTHFAGTDMVHYLNHLVTRSHTLVYQPRRMSLQRILRWFYEGVPSIFILHFRTFVLCMAIFLGFGTVGFFGSEYMENGEAIFLGIDLLDPESSMAGNQYYIEMTEDNIRAGRPFYVYEDEEHRSWMASRIMFNNIRISIYCFVGGILGGLLTFYVFALNSMMVGAFFHIFYRHDIIFDFWNTILVHGMIELTMIVFAAMAGFIIAKGLLFPGHFTRRDSLKRAGLDAVQLAVLIVLWDAIAALLESYATGNGLNREWKFTTNLITLTALISYWGILGMRGWRIYRNTGIWEWGDNNSWKP